MERLSQEQPKGLSRAGLRKWGMIFLILGVFGRSILQNRFLGMVNLNPEQLLQVISDDSQAMLFATIAIVLQFMETCATPIFCFLLTEGFAHTSNAPRYMARVLGVALISEIPFNFAMTGNFLDLSSRNPVFGIAVSLMLLYLYDYSNRNKQISLLIKVVGTLCALVWCNLLSIEHGACCVVLTVAFWSFRKKLLLRNLVGGAAAMLCSAFSLFYMVSPMSLVAVHFYNGEPGQENRWVSYLLYPALLIIFGVVGALAF